MTILQVAAEARDLNPMLRRVIHSNDVDRSPAFAEHQHNIIISHSLSHPLLLLPTQTLLLQQQPRTNPSTNLNIQSIMPPIHLTHLRLPLGPRLLRTTPALQRTRGLSPTSLRAVTATSTRRAGDQLQDKDELNPIGSEYSKSGGDNAAAHDDAAFDPSKTTPEETKPDNNGVCGVSCFGLTL